MLCNTGFLKGFLDESLKGDTTRMYLSSWKCMWTGYLANTRRKDIVLVLILQSCDLEVSQKYARFCISFWGGQSSLEKHMKTLYESFYTNFLLYSLEITGNYHLSFLLGEKLALLDIIDHNSLTIISALVTFPAYVFFTLLRLTDL